MNLSTSLLQRQQFNINSKRDIYTDMGFKDYKREITLFIKESKNINGIQNHNLVTKINGMITNYSILDDNKQKCRICTKTVYVCEIEFPAHVTLDMLKKDINVFISIATINPIHGFTNSYVVTKDSFIDLGLSMVDLTLGESHFNIVNMSNFDQSNKFLKDLIYQNKYNPKYYNTYDAAELDSYESSRVGKISDFYDNHTTIVCNTHGDESVDNFINNDRQTGIYINKRTVTISEALSDLFNKFLFINVENLEFVYNSTSNDLNITKLSLFSKFRQDLEDYLCKSMHDSIEDWINNLNSKFNGLDYYLVLSIDKQFAIIDVIFFGDKKEIRITKPLYKLYGEFSLNSETLLEDIKISGETAKLDYIEQSIQAINYSKNNDIESNLKSLISMVNNTTATLELLLADRKQEYESLVGPNKCLNDDRSQENQKH